MKLNKWYSFADKWPTNTYDGYLVRQKLKPKTTSIHFYKDAHISFSKEDLAELEWSYAETTFAPGIQKAYHKIVSDPTLNEIKEKAVKKWNLLKEIATDIATKVKEQQ